MTKNGRGKWTKMLGMVCLVVALVCTAALSGAEQGTRACEGPGWDTPEDAVRHYLEGMREQDIQKMISAHAIETYVDHFDMQAQMARMGAYIPTMTLRVPNTNDLLRGINIESRKHEVVQTAILQVIMICMPDRDFTRPEGFTGENREAEAAAFLEALEAEFGAVDFSTLEVIGFNPPELISALYASEQNQENLLAQGAPYGAEEVRSVVAVFSVDEKLGALCCDAMRYGDQWYMFRSNGNIGALIGFAATTGGMAAMDRQELLALSKEMGAEAQAGLGSLFAGLLPGQ